MILFHTCLQRTASQLKRYPKDFMEFRETKFKSNHSSEIAIVVLMGLGNENSYGECWTEVFVSYLFGIVQPKCVEARSAP